MDMLSKISRQTIWQILGKVVTAVSTFIILGLVARTYGESGTGVFTLALTYLAIFYLLADFGFNAHLLPAIQNENLDYQKLKFRKLLAVRIIWSFVLIVVAISLLPFWPFSGNGFSKTVVLGSFAILASAIFVTTNLIFQAKLRYDLSVLATSIGTIASLAIFLYLVSINAPLEVIILGHLAGWIVIALLALILVKKKLKSISPIFDLKDSLQLLKDSWPIAATLALNVIYFRADGFMLSYFKGNQDVGIYNIAYQVFQSALVLPAFIMNAYYPLMIQSLGNNDHLFRKQLYFAAAALLGMAIVGAVITILLSPVIINLLTGGGFRGAVESLQILALGFPAYFLSALLMWVLVIRKRYKLMLLLYALGLLFNLIANFILIQKYSFIGASWVTVMSEYLILVMQLVTLAIL